MTQKKTAQRTLKNAPDDMATPTNLRFSYGTHQRIEERMAKHPMDPTKAQMIRSLVNGGLDKAEEEDREARFKDARIRTEAQLEPFGADD